MKQRSLFFFVLICGGLLLAACQSAPAPKFPTGRFVSTANSTHEYSFNEDNTWAYYLGGMMAAKGTYRVDGNLWVEEGTPECPFTGTYKWTVDGANLTFTLEGEDNCQPRKEATDGITFTLSK